MKYLVHLELNENIDINFVDAILSENNVEIHFKSLDIFKKSFNKFYSILWDYAEKIKSLRAPIEGDVFEDTVLIMSELEDKLEISINHLTVDAKNAEAAKEIMDFYCDDILFNGLRISILTFDMDRNNEIWKSPIDIIAYIERGNWLGISLGIHLTSYYNDSESILFDAISKYVGVIYGWMNGTLWNKREDEDIYFVDIIKGIMR